MKRSWLHSILAWTCLVSFGLNSTALAAGLVVCDDGHGNSRVEFGCRRTSDGACADACCDAVVDDAAGEGSSDPAHSNPPGPCRDVPIRGDIETPKVTAPALHIPVPAALPVCLPPIVLVVPPLAPVRSAALAGESPPPDSRTHIRSIILVV